MLRGKRQIAFSPHRFSVDAHIAILVSVITAAGKIRKEAAHDAMCRQGETRAKTFIKNFYNTPPAIRQPLFRESWKKYTLHGNNCRLRHNHTHGETEENIGDLSDKGPLKMGQERHGNGTAIHPPRKTAGLTCHCIAGLLSLLLPTGQIPFTT